MDAAAQRAASLRSCAEGYQSAPANTRFLSGIDGCYYDNTGVAHFRHLLKPWLALTGEKHLIVSIDLDIGGVPSDTAPGSSLFPVWQHVTLENLKRTRSQLGDDPSSAYFGSYVSDGFVECIPTILSDTTTALYTVRANCRLDLLPSPEIESALQQAEELDRSFEDTVLPHLNVFMRAFRPEKCCICASGGGWRAFVPGLSAFCHLVPALRSFLSEQNSSPDEDLCLCGVSGGGWALSSFVSESLPVREEPSDQVKLLIKRAHKRYTIVGAVCRQKRLSSQRPSALEGYLTAFASCDSLSSESIRPFLEFALQVAPVLETCFELRWDDFVRTWLFKDLVEWARSEGVSTEQPDEPTTAGLQPDESTTERWRVGSGSGMRRLYGCAYFNNVQRMLSRQRGTSAMPGYHVGRRCVATGVTMTTRLVGKAPGPLRDAGIGVAYTVKAAAGVGIAVGTALAQGLSRKRRKRMGDEGGSGDPVEEHQESGVSPFVNGLAFSFKGDDKVSYYKDDQNTFACIDPLSEEQAVCCSSACLAMLDHPDWLKSQDRRCLQMARSVNSRTGLARSDFLVVELSGQLVEEFPAGQSSDPALPGVRV